MRRAESFRIQKCAFAFATLHSILTGVASGQIEYQSIALWGTPAPGLADGVIYRLFRAPSVSSNGHVAFYATLSGPGLTQHSNFGLWCSSPAYGVELVTQGRDPVPPYTKESGTFNDFRDPVVNSFGHVYFAANIANPAFHAGQGIWTWSHDLGLRAAADYPVPLTAGGDVTGVYHLDHPFVVGEQNDIALTGDLDGPGVTVDNHLATWVIREEDGAQLVSRLASPMPGFPADVLVEALGPPNITPANDVLFVTKLDGTGINRRNESVVWSVSQLAEPVVLLRGGMPAAGMAAGQNYSLFRAPPSVNVHGDLAFSAVMFPNSGITTATDGGVWVTGSGGLTIVAQEGSDAPGMPPGVVYDTFSDYVAFNDRGEAAFQGTLRGDGVNGTNDEAIWHVDADGNVRLLAREGNRPPDTPENVYYGTLFEPQINNAGTVVFDAMVVGSAVSPFYDHGLWATNPLGEVRLVYRDGIYFSIDGGGHPMYEFELVRRSSSRDGSPGCLSDDGTVAVYAWILPGYHQIMLAKIPQGCPADVNGDQLVDPADFTAWLAAFNANSLECDQNADGLCTPADFTAWISNYNAGCDW